MKRMNKTKAVLSHLQQFGTITSIEAVEMFGATRLAAIVFELRKRGYKIRTEDVPFVDRFGSSGVCAKYHLEQ